MKLIFPNIWMVRQKNNFIKTISTKISKSNKNATYKQDGKIINEILFS